MSETTKNIEYIAIAAIIIKIKFRPKISKYFIISQLC